MIGPSRGVGSRCGCTSGRINTTVTARLIQQDRVTSSKELAGLGEFEACMQNKDFENCWPLAAGILVGTKLKVLEKVFDTLKMVKRGCKVINKSTLSTSSFATFSDLPCGVHGVPGLPCDKSMITNGPGDCQVCAERIRDSIGDGRIVRIPAPGPFFGKYHGQEDYNWNNG
ncbi:hypothetical protein [Streptomyces sp. NPDC059604]|uniref:hypothetical protein n=2 Tax=unclassified Streptomyces TaxID=2593676 RepID=UPI0036884BE1